MADGVSIGSFGPVIIGTNSEVDGPALALQISSESKGTTAAAAVGVNVDLVDNTVSIGENAAIHANGIAIGARRLTPAAVNDFSSNAVYGSGGTGDAGARSASVNVLDIKTSARVETGTTLGSSGAIDVVAEGPVGLNNAAGGVAIGKGSGVGVAIAVNIVTGHATEAIVAEGDTIDALGPITVSATASLGPIVGGIPGGLTSATIGAAGGPGHGGRRVDPRERDQRVDPRRDRRGHIGQCDRRRRARPVGHGDRDRRRHPP